MATIRDPKGQRQEDDYNKDRDRNTDRDRDDDRKNDDDGCGDSDFATDITIKRERKKVCSELNDRAGEVRQWEQTRQGAHFLYDDKKCCFIYTEKNYHYYRNLELAVGVELIQANEGIKENVTIYKKWNDELAAVLKEIVKATKEAKVKFSELKDIACKLNTCVNDSCQATQKRILTGESYDNCEEEPGKDECNAKEVLLHLEKFPKTFLHDIDIIFNSAARVAGIQMFSNVATLEPLQKTMQEKSKAFDDFIQEKMKKGADDMKKIQEELVKAIQELSKSTSTLYLKRGDFKGLLRATNELCDCECECIQTGDDKNRLEDCKGQICDICDAVKAGVCKAEDNPACRNETHPERKQSTHT